jgi:tetratricopeptide (TPR) repeat protein
MQSNVRDEDRKVIPRWREASSTPASELKSLDQRLHIPLHSRKAGAEEALADWRMRKDLYTAADVLYRSLIVSDNKSGEDAARFIVATQGVAPELEKLARQYLSSGNVGSLSFSAGEQPLVNERDQIKMLKSRLEDSPRSSISRIELARLYARIGQYKNAEKHVLIALAVAPTNRFILRSACRLFVHMKELGKAAWALKKGDTSDPWILASLISVCDINGAKLPSLRLARDFVSSHDDPSQITELASALATLELKNGNTKQAKKLFKASAIRPNDNAVAQLKWASTTHKFEFQDSLLGTDLSYEARANYFFEKNDFDRAAKECFSWLGDEPFSARPAIFGSYISVEFRFAELGLRANPGNLMLKNNSAFALAAIGQIDKADAMVTEALQVARTSHERATLIATKGYIAIQNGEDVAGCSLYSEAMNIANKNKFSALAGRVYMHFLMAAIAKYPNLPPETITLATKTLERISSRDKQIRREFEHSFKTQKGNRDNFIAIPEEVHSTTLTLASNLVLQDS